MITWNDMYLLQVYTCDARERLAALEDAGVIDTMEYSTACQRFHDSWQISHDYAVQHGLI